MKVSSTLHTENIHLELDPIIELLTIKVKIIQNEIERLKLKADNL